MAYVEISELKLFMLEVGLSFLTYCTKLRIENDVEVQAPDLEALNLAYLLGTRREFTETELYKLKQIMRYPYTVVKSNNSYKSSDFLEVLDDICYLLEEFDRLTDKEIKIQYKAVLAKYADMNIEIQFSRKIHTRIRGVRGANKRYKDGLYKKHQVIYDFMLNKAKTQGKWSNLNTAVDSVLPELDIVLKQFDKEWIAKRLAEKTEEMAKLQQEFEDFKVNPPRYQLGSAKIITATREQTYTNRIREIRMECNELKKASEMDDPSILLKKQLPFNTAYQPEVIKNLLRKETDLLAEILIKQQES